MEELKMSIENQLVNYIGSMQQNNNCHNELLNYANGGGNLIDNYFPFNSTNLTFGNVEVEEQNNLFTAESVFGVSNNYSPLLPTDILNSDKSIENGDNKNSETIETPKKSYFLTSVKNSNFVKLNLDENNYPEASNALNFNLLLPELNGDNFTSPKIPLNIPNNENNRIQKTVNYFNHKFVISETEDISVDTLLSLNQNISTPITTTESPVTKQLNLKPKESIVNPLPDIQTKTKDNNNWRITTNKETATKKGESILKNSENFTTNIQLTSLSSQQDKIDINHKRVFFVKDNCMKPILSPVVSSGIFRSTGCIKKRLASKREETDKKSPKNIILSKLPYGKIITLEEFEKINNNNNINVSKMNKTIPSQTIVNNLQQQQPQNIDSIILDDSNIKSSTKYLINNSKITNGINRQLIKIPVVLPIINENNDNNNGQTKETFINDENKLMPSNNLVLNIVNMVANNAADITQRTQVSQSLLPLDEQQIKAIGSVSGTLNRNGNVSVLNDQKSVVFHNPETNTKIIYRIINPEDVNLRRDESVQVLEKSKLKKNLKQKLSRKSVGRPKGVLSKGIITYTVPNTVVLTQPTARTRAGRLSRPPKHVENYFQITTKFTEHNADPVLRRNSIENCINTIDNKPQQQPRVHIIKENNYDNNDMNVKIKRERKIPSEYKCKSCNKIYLGYNRMSRHLLAFPDHGKSSQLFQMKIKNRKSLSPPPQALYDDTIYDYLIKKIRKTNPDERTKLFFSEISNFSKKLQLLMPKLITENNEHPIEMIDSDSMKILGLLSNFNSTSGYHIDISAIDQELSTERQNIVTTEIPNNEQANELLPIHAIIPELNEEHHQQQQQRIDFNLNISMDSINDGEKTNLSDDSLLQSVDELVKERWENIIDNDLVDTTVAVNDFNSGHNNIKDNVVTPPPILDLDYLLN